MKEKDNDIFICFFKDLASKQFGISMSSPRKNFTTLLGNIHHAPGGVVGGSLSKEQIIKLKDFLGELLEKME